MNRIFTMIMCLILSSCNYSVTLVHTQGEASDVVDETATNTPSTSISPKISLPASTL